ncbi:uncharacterized protein [Aquarana catesbeiana]|uniref:uncharacterized protein n=1 Tax=Aquarana catesbeiana TaxID=8400 RepID=UPI003CC96008
MASLPRVHTAATGHATGPLETAHADDVDAKVYGAAGNKDEEFEIIDISEGAAGNKKEELEMTEGAAGNKDEEFEIIDISEVPLALASDNHVVRKGKSFKENMDKIKEIIKSTYTSILWYLQRYQKVGIFSRSSESDYEWLIKQLYSEPFRDTVCTVLPHYISNNGKQQFMDAVFGCTFVILYHTKNRGRINIVDVTDSLYDEELNYMFKCLGKENVIVVVDDLEDTSDEEKNRILESQPSIGKLAKDIILFSANK